VLVAYAFCSPHSLRNPFVFGLILPTVDAARVARPFDSQRYGFLRNDLNTKKKYFTLVFFILLGGGHLGDREGDLEGELESQLSRISHQRESWGISHYIPEEGVGHASSIGVGCGDIDLVEIHTHISCK